MTPFFMHIPNEEGDQDQSHDNVLLNANNSPFPCTILFNNLEDQGTNNASDKQHCQGQQELSHHLLSFQSNTVERPGRVDQKPNERPGKWMSSKMRFMRKMMNSEQIILKRSRRGRNTQALEDQQLNQENSNNEQSGFIRFCSDCNTTKTPLWRSGPQGPKSLCNACGIRQRKARRAMAAAAGLITVDKEKEVRKLEKGSEVDHTMPFKKRCKFNRSKQTEKKICLENVMISLSNNSGFSPPPPQDERDAAILLMSLSCNLVIS